MSRMGLLALVAALSTAATTAAQAATPPPGRAYELVSPAQKYGSPVTGSIAAAPEGGAVSYASLGAFADAQSSIGANYLARRTPTGWTTTSVNPPTPDRVTNAFDEFYVMATARDASSAIVATSYPVKPEDQGVAFGNPASSDLFRSEPGGAFTWLTPAPTLPDASVEDAGLAAAGEQLEWVAIESEKALHPDAGADGTKHVYLRAGGQTHLVSRDAAGVPFPNGGAVGQDGSLINDGPNSWKAGRHPSAVATDGGTVYFATTGTFEQLYVRQNALDPATAQTRWVSESEITPGSGCGNNTDFLAASADGRRAYFFCQTALDAATPGSGGLYAYDAVADDVELIGANLGGAGGSASVINLGHDRDARHVYFWSKRRLVPDAVASQENLYVIVDGEVRLIKVLTNVTTFTDGHTSVSPDGTAFVFQTREQISPQANGFDHVYRYDLDATVATEADKITCVSCRPDGSPSQGEGGLRDLDLDGFGPTNNVRPFGNVSDDGSRVFFTSDDALLPQDTNDVADAYELRDGELHLLSSGRDPHPSVFMGASADGTDALIVTHENMTGWDVDNGVADLYSVRLGGGFPEPPVTVPCEGDACRGPVPPRPVLPAPVTDGTADGGDIASSSRPAFHAVRLKAADLRRLAAGRRVSLRVRVNKAGTVRVRGRARIGRRTRTVLTASRHATRAGTVTARVRLSNTARRQLSRGRRVRIALSVSFTGVRAPDRMTLNLRKRASR